MQSKISNTICRHGVVAASTFKEKIIMENVGVFIDYSNVHLVGHGLFAPDLDRWLTHLSPQLLSKTITRLRGREARLSGIFLYRGSPDRFRDPEATKRFREQKERWGADPLFRGTYPPMVYGHNRVRPKEAGVDVRLGLDFVKAADSRQFDVVVLFSGDSDLFPAVQDAVRTTTRVELAAWSTGLSTPGNLVSHQSIRSFHLWTHMLSEETFWDCQDDIPAAA